MATVHSTAKKEFDTSVYLAKEVTTARVVPATATNSEAWWLIWLANCK